MRNSSGKAQSSECTVSVSGRVGIPGTIDVMQNIPATAGFPFWGPTLAESYMAARINRRHSDQVRAKIQASNLIHRLHQCAEGEIELTATQVRAIEALLDRSVPKLSQIQHVGEEGGAINHNLVIKFGAN